MSTTSKTVPAAGRFQRLPTVNPVAGHFLKHSRMARSIGAQTKPVCGGNVKEVDSPASSSGAVKKNASRGTLVVKVESREGRIRRIKKSLRTDQLPAVSVKIAERHLTQTIVRSGAEIELGSILKECGFIVVDEKLKQKPEIRITGEAFSAHSPRKANQVTCRFHLELKAKNGAGEILAEDDQMNIAVNIAEQTAARMALQNAVMKMAERLLPKLVLMRA